MIAELMASPRTVPSLAPAAMALVPATPLSPTMFCTFTGVARTFDSPSATIRPRRSADAPDRLGTMSVTDGAASSARRGRAPSTSRPANPATTRLRARRCATDSACIVPPRSLLQVYGIEAAATNTTAPRVGRRAPMSAHSYAVELFYMHASARCQFVASARRQLLDCNGRQSGTPVAASFV